MRRLLIGLTLGLSACATFERSAQSGYRNRAPFAGEYAVNLNPRLEREAREELGFGERSLNREEARALALRVQVKEAEARLPSRRERRQYYQMRGTLRDDRERLAVLRLPDPSTRARYANARRLNAADGPRPAEIAAAIDAKDIALGMSQKAVSESWGDADAVEHAGDSVYGVERWRYNRYVSGADGFRKETRTVYFEGGRVTGWERN